jgi:aspartyl-tRNA(Asn)/glutamyl-tRNA(Gln) amidotransferase subunit A
MPDLTSLSLELAAALLARKEVSSEELTRACLERIRATEAEVHAFITPTEDVALQQARAADARRARGENGPLLGIPLALKDIILTKGIRTTAG